MDEYIAPSLPELTPVVKDKKRKKPSDDDSENRKKARLYCSCPAEWTAISKYNPKRLQEFIDEKEFLESKNLHNSVFSFVHKAVAHMLDFLSKGDGFVHDEVMNDLSLRTALENEGSNFVNLLNNKCKIIALSSANVYHGKSKQKVDKPQVYVQEIVNDDVPIDQNATTGDQNGDITTIEVVQEEELVRVDK
jgi:hypothetical protein